MSLWWDHGVAVQQPGTKSASSACRQWDDPEDDEEGDGWPTDAEVGDQDPKPCAPLQTRRPPRLPVPDRVQACPLAGGASGCVRSRALC